jgi:hypothetical protein
LLLTGCLLSVVGTAVVEAAPGATSSSCAPAAFTGSVRAHPSRCVTSATGLRGPRGPRGARGISGLRGVTGLSGQAGLDGLQGTPGTAGATGAQGIPGTASNQGAQGIQGIQGNDGAAGATGPQGTIGPAGATGPSGTAGATGGTGGSGPTGPSGATGAAGGLSQYSYIYNTGAQNVALEAAVTFDTNGLLSAGIAHTPGTAAITIANAGVYAITFSVSGTQQNQMALFVGAGLVPGSDYGSGSGTQLNSGQVIVTLAAGSVITLVNHTSPAAVTLETVAGGTQVNTDASIIIEQIG